MYSASGAGRFMQADPIGLKAADLKKPESLNRYSYVQNDPVNFVDRTGTLLQAPFRRVATMSDITGVWSNEPVAETMVPPIVYTKNRQLVVSNHNL
jgi:uncharacterized protein RhaS with RHS repeats